MDSICECSFEGCFRAPRCRGLCNTHYEQKRLGRPSAPIKLTAPHHLSAAEPIALHVVVDEATGCHVYTGITHPKKYPIFVERGVSRNVHVVAYELAFGPVPEGMMVDHKCRNRHCVNARHLHAVTRKENNENLDARSTNASGHRGVFMHKTSGLWQVQVTHNRKKYSGGYFRDVEEAAEAARDLRNQLFTNNRADWDA